MGTYANFFIEVKNKETGAWEAIMPYYPFKERQTQCYDEKGNCTVEVTKPVTATVDGQKLDRMQHIWRQGYVRDVFATSWHEMVFKGRGLPEDMSAEVKNCFDEMTARIEKEKADYFEKYGTEKPFGGKWWWGETYATVSELETLFDKKLEDWRKDIEKAYATRYEDGPMNEKLDEILSILKNSKKKKKEEEEEWDDVAELMEDTLWDILNLWQFIGVVREMAEQFTERYPSDDNIRVIAYCD